MANGWRVGGFVVGIVAAIALANTPASWLGLGIALSGPAFALCLLGGVIIGELRSPPIGPVRTASLRIRRPALYLPRSMTDWVAVSGLILLAFLGATTAVGAADDMGRPGRWLAVTCGPDRSAAAGPWPGVFYSGPIIAAVLVGLAAAGLAIRIVVIRRPQTGDSEHDEASRRRTARTIIAACGVLTAAPLAGSAMLASWALRAVACGGQWLGPLSWASLGVSAAALLGAAACVATVLYSDNRSGVDRRRPAL